MAKTWRCGDCGAVYPKAVHYCTRPLDDYLSLRGGSIEAAITQAVARAIDPLVKAAVGRLRPRITYEIGATVMVPVTYKRISPGFDTTKEAYEWLSRG
jgi:hypothetical protein